MSSYSLQGLCHNCAYHEVKVRVDLVKEKLVQDVRTRRYVTLQLVAYAISFKLGQHKECYRRKAKVIGIDIHQPAIPMSQKK